MRIITSSYVKKRITSITIEAENDKEDLKYFEAALNSHKWIRQNLSGELETAPAHRNPPLLFDQDIDPIWDGKPAKIRQVRKDKKKRASFDDRAFYVQHISGYDGNRLEKAPKLILAGFQPLRSRRSSKDGQMWEIWYLCGAWAAKGELEGKTEEQIIDWLIQEIRPGQMELSGQAWALVID